MRAYAQNLANQSSVFYPGQEHQSNAGKGAMKSAIDGLKNARNQNVGKTTSKKGHSSNRNNVNQMRSSHAYSSSQTPSTTKFSSSGHAGNNFFPENRARGQGRPPSDLKIEDITNGMQLNRSRGSHSQNRSGSSQKGIVISPNSGYNALPNNGSQTSKNYSAYQQVLTPNGGPQQGLNKSAQQINSYASQKSNAFLQKKAGFVSPTGGHQEIHNGTNQIRRVGTASQSETTSKRRSNTRTGSRNLANQSQFVNNFTSSSNIVAASPSALSPISPPALGNYPQTTKFTNAPSANRNQKDVIVRKNSQKALQNNQDQAQPKHQRGKSQPAANSTSKILSALRTEDESTADGAGTSQAESNRLSVQKYQSQRIAQRMNGQRSEERGTSPDVSNKHQAITHTLGNTLGGKPSLDMSKQYGVYSTSGMREGSLAQTRPVNLQSLLSNNLLEEDGIEDLHFYFVSFNQHKKLIVKHQRAKCAAPQKGSHKGKVAPKRRSSRRNRTIESCDSEELF